MTIVVRMIPMTTDGRPKRPCCEYASFSLSGVLLVREAGGSVYGINGDDFDIMGRHCLVAASRELAMEAIEAIEKYETPREFPEKCIV